MEDRQTQIKEGAGLEESRINTDLLEFLNKWSTPVLVVILLIVGGMWAKRWWDAKQIAKVNDAYFQYDQAMAGGNPSPDSLKRVAESFAGVRGVDLMARLDTADVYLNAARTGLAPGATIDPTTGELTAPEADLLNADTRAQYLADAGRMYQGVLDEATTRNHPMLTTEAAFGVAAVLASDAAKFDEARAAYKRAGEVAAAGGFKLLAQVASDRAAGVGDLTELPMLYKEADLPELPSNEAAIDAIDAMTGGVDAAKAADTSNLELTADFEEEGDQGEPVDPEADPTEVP